MQFIVIIMASMWHKRVCSAAVAAAGAILIAGVVRAQSATIPQVPAAQQPGQPTFRTEVSVVTLDVIPRDAHGQFVTNLLKDDFEVLEDGVRQEIASVTLVHGGRVFNVRELAPPPAQEGIILPSAPRANQAAGRIFVIVVDDLHVDAHDTPHVRALLKKIASTVIHEGDMFAMISTGPSAVEEPMTYDRNRIQIAISKVKGSGLALQDMFAAGDGALGPPDVRRRAHVAFTVAYQLIQGLENVKDRRKALILISNGYDFDPFPEARAGKDKVFGGRYGTPYVDEERGERFMTLEAQHNRFADADLAAELRGLANAANRANVSIYSIDPRGLAGTVSAELQLDRDEWRTHLQKTQGSLRALAESTGGVAVVNDNDFTGALKRIDAETSDYYVLGYYLLNNDPTRRTRQIEVRVRRDDVKVWSRASYKLKPQPVGNRQ